MPETRINAASTLGCSRAQLLRNAASPEARSGSPALVSTLGAGDVFHGALLAMLHEGQTLADALAAANVAAGLSCRALDGRSAIPTRGELEKCLTTSR